MLKFVAAVIFAAIFGGTSALADPLGYAPASYRPNSTVEQILPDGVSTEDQQESIEIPAHLQRQVVAYQTVETPGSIIIDTPNTYLYYVLGGGKAIRYGIGVGREGFTWSGVLSIARKTEWPDWYPPAEMIERQPYLPRFMAGGPGNPLGARAMYLGNSVYRIHGTNAPQTIGQKVSSGCIRMLNEDVVDLYGRVNVGTRVVVLPATSLMSSSFTARDGSIPMKRSTIAATKNTRAFGLY